MDPRTAVVEARYNWIASVCRRAVLSSSTPRLTLTARLDSVLTHRVWGVVAFVGLMALVFQAIMSWAVGPMDAIDQGVGLAAPQIGENVRLFAVDVTGHRKAKSCAGLIVLANPHIVTRAGNVVMREGCVSVPHFTGDVARAAEVIVTGVVPPP